MKHTAFDTLHPVVPAVFVLFTLGLTMFSFQPVLVTLSLIGAFVYCCCTCGLRTAAMTLRWQLAVVLLVTLINPIFTRRGTTELFVLFGIPVYLESLCFGAAMGALFMASVLWFQTAGTMLSYDKVLSLFGGRIPVISLMVSMTMRLVPQMMRRGREITSTQDVAMTCAATPSRRRFVLNTAQSRLRQSSVLMGWSMEESLQTADAMRARGWGAARQRTTYARYHFGAADAIALAALTVIGVLCCMFAHRVAAGYSFYPTMTSLAFRWEYLLYAAWMLLPTVLHAYEEMRFR